MIRIVLGLAAVGLVWFVAADSEAQQPRAAREPEVVGWPREVKGYGKTIELARKNAYDEAVRKVTAFLRCQNPPLDAWQPDEAYVVAHLRDGEGRVGDDVQLVDGVVSKEWIQPLLDAPPMGEMSRLNQVAQRSERSVARQQHAGFGLAILTALLAAGWGFLRLEEYTDGRCSKWIGVGAATLLAVCGLAWWLSI